MKYPLSTNRLYPKWDANYASTLDQVGKLIYRSNLLGSDQRITNTGGGNTSAKLIENDPLSGDKTEVRAAASSIASGIPSKRRTISSTTLRSSGLRRNALRTFRAQATMLLCVIIRGNDRRCSSCTKPPRRRRVDGGGAAVAAALPLCGAPPCAARGRRVAHARRGELRGRRRARGRHRLHLDGRKRRRLARIRAWLAGRACRLRA